MFLVSQTRGKGGGNEKKKEKKVKRHSFTHLPAVIYSPLQQDRLLFRRTNLFIYLFLLRAARGHVNGMIDCANSVSVRYKQAVKQRAHLEQHPLPTTT